MAQPSAEPKGAGPRDATRGGVRHQVTAGIGGATGALATGLFARAALNNGHGGGLELLGKQAIGVAAAGAWAAIVTFVLLEGVDLLVGLRVDAETEHDGLDGALHGESAYGSPGSVAHSG